MKRFLLLCLLCLTAINSYASDLVFATGNDYYNTCSTIDLSNADKCYSVVTTSFTSVIATFPLSVGMDGDCYFDKYDLGNLTPVDINRLTIAFLKNNNDMRKFPLGASMFLIVVQNYPPSKECKKPTEKAEPK